MDSHLLPCGRYIFCLLGIILDMASDVTNKAPGPLWKPSKLTKQGVLDLDKVKGQKQQKIYRWYWHGWKGDGKWVVCRKAWLDQNPPDYRGYYICALCGGNARKEEVTLDHILTRSQRPDLKYDLDNLQPAHFLCNHKRGSMSMEAWNAQRLKFKA